MKPREFALHRKNHEIFTRITPANAMPTDLKLRDMVEEFILSSSPTLADVPVRTLLCNRNLNNSRLDFPVYAARYLSHKTVSCRMQHKLYSVLASEFITAPTQTDRQTDRAHTGLVKNERSARDIQTGEKGTEF